VAGQAALPALLVLASASKFLFIANLLPLAGQVRFNLLNLLNLLAAGWPSSDLIC
jgi:hypothetical protein